MLHKQILRRTCNYATKIANQESRNLTQYQLDLQASDGDSRIILLFESFGITSDSHSFVPFWMWTTLFAIKLTCLMKFLHKRAPGECLANPIGRRGFSQTIWKPPNHIKAAKLFLFGVQNKYPKGC